MSNYELIKTEDGSFTVYSPLHTESCHSVEGAKSETFRYYVEGCEVIKKAQQNGRVNILEVGFGIGVGLQCTLESLERISTSNGPFLYYLALEKDEFLINEYFQKLIWVKCINYPQQKNIKKGFYFNLPCYELTGKNFQLIILIGNARETLVQFSEYNFENIKFDCIYQDAFSIQKNPELWTVEWFKLIKKFANQETIMSTYSASSRIRKSMLAAEWRVISGLKFGNKRMSTRAKIIGQSENEILKKLALSPVLELKDSDLNISINDSPLMH